MKKIDENDMMKIWKEMEKWTGYVGDFIHDYLINPSHVLEMMKYQKYESKKESYPYEEHDRGDIDVQDLEETKAICQAILLSKILELEYNRMKYNNGDVR
ncbi:MAG: hypothetical protein ABEK36_01250 [Candidatus Aenigmatarchaeota archaeon]